MSPIEKEVEQLMTKLNEWNAEIDALEQKAARRHQSKEMYAKHIDELETKLFNGKIKQKKIQKRFAA